MARPRQAGRTQAGSWQGLRAVHGMQCMALALLGDRPVRVPAARSSTDSPAAMAPFAFLQPSPSGLAATWTARELQRGRRAWRRGPAEKQAGPAEWGARAVACMVVPGAAAQARVDEGNEGKTKEWRGLVEGGLHNPRRAGQQLGGCPTAGQADGPWDDSALLKPLSLWLHSTGPGALEASAIIHRVGHTLPPAGGSTVASMSYPDETSTISIQQHINTVENQAVARWGRRLIVPPPFPPSTAAAVGRGGPPAPQTGCHHGVPLLACALVAHYKLAGHLPLQASSPLQASCHSQLARHPQLTAQILGVGGCCLGLGALPSGHQLPTAPAAAFSRAAGLHVGRCAHATPLSVTPLSCDPPPRSTCHRPGARGAATCPLQRRRLAHQAVLLPVGGLAGDAAPGFPGGGGGPKVGVESGGPAVKRKQGTAGTAGRGQCPPGVRGSRILAGTARWNSAPRHDRGLASA